jgi:hypothetical protein
MAVCDGHGAVCRSEKELKNGEGYLLAAPFMQRSVIQDKNLEVGVTMGLDREQYRREFERMQGKGPWLLCEDCMRLLNLSEADQEAAREAAKKWWTDNGTPGHMPGTSKAMVERPAKAGGCATLVIGLLVGMTAVLGGILSRL